MDAIESRRVLELFVSHEEVDRPVYVEESEVITRVDAQILLITATFVRQSNCHFFLACLARYQVCDPVDHARGRFLVEHRVYLLRNHLVSLRSEDSLYLSKFRAIRTIIGYLNIRSSLIRFRYNSGGRIVEFDFLRRKKIETTHRHVEGDLLETFVVIADVADNELG